MCDLRCVGFTEITLITLITLINEFLSILQHTPTYNAYV